ncbi:MAG: site-2 protease family protein, partial [Candidatus Nomurabacteria bacterium]|nr:site-2 protease family protein [Candidatus Nomurabacteria bacterium]
LSFFPALWEGLKLDWAVTKGTVVGLYTLIADGIKGQGSFASVAGPVGMVGIVGDASQFGFAYLLSFAALISVNLAIINLIPFPALDGGRLLFLLIEKIKGSRIRPEIANTANTIGFFILIALMLVVTYHDVVKLF